jgi:hypothetical protein
MRDPILLLYGYPYATHPARRAGALQADALLEVREEDRGGRSGCEAQAARSPEEHTLKFGLPSEQIARTVDALAALLRVSTLKLSTPVAEPQS